MIAFSKIALKEDALQNNIDFIKNEIGSGTELVSVVKGNAYGHGIESFVPMLHNCGVRNFAVFNSEEAYRIVQTGTPFDRLLIMGAIHDDDLHWIIEKEIDCFVFSEKRLHKGIAAAKQQQKPFRVHLEIETGMNRTGIEKEAWQPISDLLLSENQHVSLQGICTHLAGAEEIANYTRIQDQLACFEEARSFYESKGISFLHAHIACSAGVINYPETIGSLVRVGILQYGFWPSKESRMAWLTRNSTAGDPLKRVIQWSSEIMSIKSVAQNEYIGYGLSFLTECPMKVATVPIGYSNGYSRSLSNRGKVLVRGKRVDVIGVVNMNLLMIDITNLNEVEEGDEVVLIGNQNDQEISVASFSDFSNLLNYQLLTRIPERIPRLKE